MHLLSATSGGHVNPAVTWALFLDRRISVVRFVLYILAQFIGGFAGAGMFPDQWRNILVQSQLSLIMD